MKKMQLKLARRWTTFSTVGIAILNFCAGASVSYASPVVNKTKKIDPSIMADSGLLPITRTYGAENFPDLFPPSNSVQIKPGKPTGASNLIVDADGTPTSSSGASSSSPSQNSSSSGQPSVSVANVPDDFKCKLFENPPYEQILSAINTISAAVTSPSCGASKINPASVQQSNKVIQDNVTALRAYLENPDQTNAPNAADIAAKVDAAIRATSEIANTFASSDLFSSDCRGRMNTGDVALAINDLMNGLTPYALMAASMTGGTAAVPYIVGGAVVTSAVSSINKLIEENTIKIGDASVRRAIIENTCQYIRLDQKYKFLVKSRDEQIKKISTELEDSKTLFSINRRNLFSVQTNKLIDQKATLAKNSFELNSVLNLIKPQLDLDLQFTTTTKDPIKVCQLGIQAALLKQNSDSYIGRLMDQFAKVIDATDAENNAQARALQASADYASNMLLQAAEESLSPSFNFERCASYTSSLLETMNQSITLSRQLLKLQANSVDQALARTKDYALLKNDIMMMDEKTAQAQRLTGALDNLKAYTGIFTQAEIDTEIDRVRSGLFGSQFLGNSSPVEKWFSYTSGLHNNELRKFKESLTALRKRAYTYTTSSKSGASGSIFSTKAREQLAKDVTASQNLHTLTLQNMPIGSDAHTQTCRELDEAWYRWNTTLNQLRAMDAFCSMIDPYLFESKPSDAQLLQTCRLGGRINAGVQASSVEGLKANLVKTYVRDWALYIKKKSEQLLCPTAIDALETK